MKSLYDIIKKLYCLQSWVQSDENQTIEKQEQESNPPNNEQGDTMNLSTIYGYAKWIEKCSPGTRSDGNYTYGNEEMIYFFRPLLTIIHGNNDFELSNHTTVLKNSTYTNVKKALKLTGCLRIAKSEEDSDFVCGGFSINSKYFMFPKTAYQKLCQANNWEKCIVNYSSNGEFPSYNVTLKHDTIQEIGEHLVYCQMVNFPNYYNCHVTMPIAPLKETPPVTKHGRYQHCDFYPRPKIDADWIYTLGNFVLDNYSNEMKKFYQSWHKNKTGNNKYISPGLATSVDTKEEESSFEMDCFLKSCGSPIFNGNFEMMGIQLDDKCLLFTDQVKTLFQSLIYESEPPKRGFSIKDYPCPVDLNLVKTVPIPERELDPMNDSCSVVLNFTTDKKDLDPTLL